MSYTSFRYETVAAPATFAVGEGSKPFTVRVTNTGDMDADEVVLGFSRLPNAGKDGTPLQALFDFERVLVKAGETTEVTLHLDQQFLTHVDTQGTRHTILGDHEVSFGVQAAGMAFARTVVKVVEVPPSIMV